MPGWRNGRLEGLKIPWINNPCGFESRPRHLILVSGRGEIGRRVRFRTVWVNPMWVRVPPSAFYFCKKFIHIFLFYFFLFVVYFNNKSRNFIICIFKKIIWQKLFEEKRKQLKNLQKGNQLKGWFLKKENQLRKKLLQREKHQLRRGQLRKRQPKKEKQAGKRSNRLSVFKKKK